MRALCHYERDEPRFAAEVAAADAALARFETRPNCRLLPPPHVSDGPRREDESASMHARATMYRLPAPPR